MQHIVATLRAYLQERHAQGALPRPLHLQIDTPRVYRGERLPRALPWVQVQGFLQSIDRSPRSGGETSRSSTWRQPSDCAAGSWFGLTLDDVDWRARILRIQQTKTRQTLRLPLTDEAADVLIDYLRNARPKARAVNSSCA